MLHSIYKHLPPGHPWGQSILYLDTIDSTNTYAKALAENSAPHGTVVIAREQTGGRGRRGRSFSSPAGMGLYLSLLLRPKCAPDALMHLTCATGVAASDAVFAASGIRPNIKWTNDLVLGNQKLGGILTELSLDSRGKIDYAIVGIGINCMQGLQDFPTEIRQIATSLTLTSGKAPDMAVLAAALIDALYHMSEGLLTDKASVMDTFRQRCITLGREISILRGEQITHATAESVDDDGGLVVVYSDGGRGTITSGEVSIRGMYGYL